MKNKRKLFKLILRFLIFTLVVGYFASSIIQSTFASSIDKKPNVTITIDKNRKITQNGSLFGNGLLYPATVKDAEKGIGGISGVIRIENQYSSIDISSIGLGLKEEEMVINNNYSRDIVYKSFLDDIEMKIEKGRLFDFNRTLVDYTNIRGLLYDLYNKEDRGLELTPKISMTKGETIDLKYTLHMVEEAGNELQAVTANMPIYINIGGSHDRDNDDDRKDPPVDDQIGFEDETYYEVDIGEVPLGTHWAHDCIITLLDHGVIIGFPHDKMTIEDYRNGRVDPAVYVIEAVQPDKYITRAEAAAIVARALGLEEVKSTITGYIDPIPKWARGHIISTTKAGIFTGYPGRIFRPQNYITREEMIAVLIRAFEIQLEDNDVELTFEDKDEIGKWAMEYVKAGFEKKVIVGYPDNTYKPKNNITRGETFTIICKLMGLHEEHIKE